MHELAYAAHSGYGVQQQALLTAVFLANASGLRLVLPPWFARESISSWLFDPTVSRGCSKDNRTLPLGVRSKMDLTERGSQELCRRCTQAFDAHGSLWDIRRLVQTRPLACHDCQRTCSRLHLDARLFGAYPPDAHAWRRRFGPANCGAVMPPDSPGWCDSLLAAIGSELNDLASEQSRSTTSVCVGPLNDWFYTWIQKYRDSRGNFVEDTHNRTVLGACARSHPLARQLDQLGLPAQERVYSLLPRLFSERCGTCVFVRLPDNDQSPRTLDRYLRWPDMANTVARQHARLVGGRNATFEVVSSCHPAAACSSVVQKQLAVLTGAVTKRRARGEPPLSSLISSLGAASSGPPARSSHPPVWKLGGMEPATVSGAVSLLARELAISAGAARIVYDQLRCARCQHVHQLRRRSDKRFSSFFQAIERLHRQLLTIDRPAPPHRFHVARPRVERERLFDAREQKVADLQQQLREERARSALLRELFDSLQGRLQPVKAS